MKITLICSLLLFTTVTFAQETIIRDTINLRGYIYQSDGKPAKYFKIISTYSLATEYSAYANIDAKLWALTDTNGYFELRGARPYDTLTMDYQLFYGPQYYYNRGSRYMVIYLPPLKVVDITTDKPVIITQKRKYPKAPAVYHPKLNMSTVDFFDVHVLPRYKGLDYNSSKNQYVVFSDSLRARINYPAKAIANNIEGLVEVSFTVDRSGNLNFKLLQGIGYGCDEEVINAIRHLPGWIPAIYNGRILLLNRLSPLNLN